MEMLLPFQANGLQTVVLAGFQGPAPRSSEAVKARGPGISMQVDNDLCMVPLLTLLAWVPLQYQQ